MIRTLLSNVLVNAQSAVVNPLQSDGAGLPAAFAPAKKVPNDSKCKLELGIQGTCTYDTVLALTTPTVLMKALRPLSLRLTVGSLGFAPRPSTPSLNYRSFSTHGQAIPSSAIASPAKNSSCTTYSLPPPPRCNPQVMHEASKYSPPCGSPCFSQRRISVSMLLRQCVQSKMPMSASHRMTPILAVPVVWSTVVIQGS